CSRIRSSERRSSGEPRTASPTWRSPMTPSTVGMTAKAGAGMRAAAESSLAPEPVTRVPIRASTDARRAVELVRRRGFAVLRGAGEAELAIVVGSLGRVIHELDVRPRRESRALVTSMRDLPPHSDQHRARYIVWR